MRGYVVGLALVAAIPSVAEARDRETEVLARKGKWTLNETPESCELYAQFGEGDATVIARFTRFEPGEDFSLTLLGKRVRSSSAVGEVEIDFGLKGTPIEAPAMFGSLGKWDASFLRGVRLDGWVRDKPDDQGPPITPQQEAGVSGMTVEMKGKRPFRLAFGALAKPFAQLRECTAGLVSFWGYDPQVQTRLRRRVTAANSPLRWVTYEDYPMTALRSGESGFVTVRLDVDAAGAIAKCHVAERTDQDEFAKTVCRAILKRAKLEPALDEQGQPIRSYMILKWRFQIGM